jgi:Clp amino terminal domain, pathogenicity island component
MGELALETLSRPIDAAPGSGPLDRLRAAAATADDLRGLGDALLDRYVQAARAGGCSWTEIGAALGVSKQAAHERFVAAPLTWPPRFDEPARRVVARAVAEARGFGHRYLGTEHLLLAASADPAPAGATLAELGIAEPTVRGAIERMVGRGRPGPDGVLGMTPRTKRVFAAAVKEAQRLGGRHACASTEHLLLALSANEGVARDILAAGEVDAATLRERLAARLQAESPELAAQLRTRERRGVRRRAR